MCWCRFRRQGSEGSGEFWCGLLPCDVDRSSHVIALITGITVNIVHMGKTTAQKGAHVVKDGKRHTDVMLLLLGIPPKLIQCAHLHVPIMCIILPLHRHGHCGPRQSLAHHPQHPCLKHGRMFIPFAWRIKGAMARFF